MERTRLAAVVQADMGWSDIGSWDQVWADLEHDAHGNALPGAAVVLDSRNSLVRSEDGVLTAVVGLDDVVVVTTDDAVLVASRWPRLKSSSGSDPGPRHHCRTITTSVASCDRRGPVSLSTMTRH
jgi:hypothetical protein